jgi:hypothetical protein
MMLIAKKKSLMRINTNGVSEIFCFSHFCKTLSIYIPSKTFPSDFQDFGCSIVKGRLNKSKLDKSIGGLINNHPVLINNQLII